MKQIIFETIDSTNKYIQEHYEELDNFDAIQAHFQTAGKGRENRAWISKEKENALISIVIKDRDLLDNFKTLSLGSAYLVAQILESYGIKNIQIKWPNDVYVDEKKICGILLSGNINEFIAVGIGLNVNQKEFVGDYRIAPTSMFLETGKNFDINEIGAGIAGIFEKLNEKDFKENAKKYIEKHNYLLGKKVKLNNTEGVVTGIGDNFEIEINDECFDSGEISIF